jgi:hypothetical protein
MFAAEAAELAELEPLARLLLVLGRAVVAALAVLARQGNDVSHDSTSGFRLPAFAWALGFQLAATVSA